MDAEAHPMIEIDAAAALLKVAHDGLEAAILTAEQEVARAIKKHRAAVAKAAGAFKIRKAALEALIARYPALFVKPKTRTLHGVKAGYRKGTGKLVWDDDDRVVAAIRARLPERASQLIRTTHAPDRAALEALAAKTLKSLGVTITDADDKVVVSIPKSTTETRVAALLGEKK